MRLLLDECVSEIVARRLLEAGFDVLRVAGISPGVVDNDVLSLAQREQALLVTEDRDFGRLVFAEDKHAKIGVLLVRLTRVRVHDKAVAVADVLVTHGEQLLGKFSTLSEGSLRIRRLPD